MLKPAARRVCHPPPVVRSFHEPILSAAFMLERAWSACAPPARPPEPMNPGCAFGLATCREAHLPSAVWTRGNKYVNGLEGVGATRSRV